MARPLRIQAANSLYHITSRGDNRKKVFVSAGDYEKFLKYLQEAKERYQCWVYAYCLMSNHYHLLLETIRPNLSQIMHYLNGAYTVYLHKKRNSCGHVFQGRYKSILVEKESYFLELSRYIHLNPVRAKIVSGPEEYRWSSYGAYVGEGISALIDSERARDYAGMSREAYQEFVRSGIGQKSKVLAEVHGGMVLGRQEFIAEQVSRLEPLREKVEISYRRQLQPDCQVEETIARLKAATQGSVAVQQRRRGGGTGRNIEMYLMRKYTELTNAQIGRRFGISYSAVSKVVREVAVAMELDVDLRNLIDHINSQFKG